MALDVITAGELYIDLILSGLDHWPQPGEEALAEHLHRGPGGGAAITAIGLAKLGMRAGVLGAVGEDGAWMVEELRRNGVDTARIATIGGESTGTTVAVSNAVDRAFFTHPGANREFAEVARAAILDAPHVHWAGAADPELFEQFDGTVSLDVGFAQANRDTMDALPLVDLFFPNEVEAARMTGEREPEAMLRAFEKASARSVVLKMGQRGSAMLVENRLLYLASPRVTAIDTTGAGDSFDAGFLFSWLRGKDPEECLRLGNLCGALSTRAPGIGAFPDRKEIACLEK